MRDDFRPASVTRPENESLHEIRTWIKRQSGITFSPDQDAQFADRVSGLCRELKLTAEQLLLKVTQGDKLASQRLVEVASTNYTFFFREPEIFAYLIEQVLPRLPQGPLRFWSAAASSGDEAYSLAMAVCETLGDAGRTRTRILGTDISGKAVASAELGVYPRDQLSQLATARLARWFTPANKNLLRVSDQLKQMCTFRRFNLTQNSWPFEQRFHVIFLRNVLYYFEPRTRRRILEACYDAAEPNAVLITSVTEPMVDVTTRWTALRPAIFRKGER